MTDVYTLSRLDVPLFPSVNNTPATKYVAEQSASITIASSNSPSRYVFVRGNSLQEKLFDARASCKRIARGVSRYFDASWQPKLFAQLDNLMDPDEWDSRDEPVSEDSFGTFIYLLLSVLADVRPSLGIAGNGNLLAVWSAGKGDRLTIECLPNGRVRWVLTVPIADGHESASGETSVDRLMAILQPYDPDHWLYKSISAAA